MKISTKNPIDNRQINTIYFAMKIELLPLPLNFTFSEEPIRIPWGTKTLIFPSPSSPSHLQCLFLNKRFCRILLRLFSPIRPQPVRTFIFNTSGKQMLFYFAEWISAVNYVHYLYFCAVSLFSAGEQEKNRKDVQSQPSFCRFGRMKQVYSW